MQRATIEAMGIDYHMELVESQKEKGAAFIRTCEFRVDYGPNKRAAAEAQHPHFGLMHTTMHVMMQNHFLSGVDVTDWRYVEGVERTLVSIQTAAKGRA